MTQKAKRQRKQSPAARPAEPPAEPPAAPRPRRIKPLLDPTSLDALVPDPTNRRIHNPRNVEMIAAALRGVGAARSIVIDERNEVLAGNGVVEGARAAGLSKVQVVDADGDTIIAVRRRGLTDAQKRDLAIYDNRTAELAEWNTDQLAVDLAAGADLQPFFFPKELDKLLGTPAVLGDAADQVVDGKFLIIVTCTTEAQQVELLDRFGTEGLECKALVS